MFTGRKRRASVVVVRVAAPPRGERAPDGGHQLVFDLLLGVLLQVRLHGAGL